MKSDESDGLADEIINGPSCGKCRFFQLLSDSVNDCSDDLIIGECRRYAPRPVQYGEVITLHSPDIFGANFPELSQFNWCGEFQPR